jgi:hypothetical protein
MTACSLQSASGEMRKKTVRNTIKLQSTNRLSSLPGHEALLGQDKEDDLAFAAACLKEGHQLKHLNSDSPNPPHVFRAISTVTLATLANLT